MLIKMDCANSGGGGASVNKMLENEQLTTNPTTATTDKAYDMVVLYVKRGQDTAQAAPTLDLAVGSVTATINPAKGAENGLVAFNVSASTTVSIQRTSGTVGQVALLDVTWYGINY